MCVTLCHSILLFSGHTDRWLGCSPVCGVYDSSYVTYISHDNHMTMAWLIRWNSNIPQDGGCKNTPSLSGLSSLQSESNADHNHHPSSIIGINLINQLSTTTMHTLISLISLHGFIQRVYVLAPFPFAPISHVSQLLYELAIAQTTSFTDPASFEAYMDSQLGPSHIDSFNNMYACQRWDGSEMRFYESLLCYFVSHPTTGPTRRKHAYDYGWVGGLTWVLRAWTVYSQAALAFHPSSTLHRHPSLFTCPSVNHPSLFHHLPSCIH